MREAMDDATLTAYALGELSDRERAAIEARLAESEELRLEVDEIRSAASLVRQALAAAPQAALTADQRAAIETEAARAALRQVTVARWWLPIGLTAAAVLLVALATWLLVPTGGPTTPGSPEVVAREETPAILPVPEVAGPDEAPVARTSATPRPVETPRRVQIARPAATPRPTKAPAVAAQDARAANATAPPMRPPSEKQQPPESVVPATSTPPSTQVAGAVTPASTPQPTPGLAAAAGMIRGTATDPQGGVIPGAQVSVTNKATGVEQTAVTNVEGGYSFPYVQPGVYDVKAEMPGFKTFSINGVRLAAADSLTLDVKLDLGAVTETVTVAAIAAEPMKTASAAVMAYAHRSRPKKEKKQQQVASGVPAGVVGGAPSPVPSRSVAAIQSPDPFLDQDTLRMQSAEFTTEAYDHIRDNPFIRVSVDPRSTFSVDVDSASYSNVRRFLNDGQLPPKDAVRIEELVNYFRYDYEPPTGPHPFAAHMETAGCPWTPAHRLVRIAIKGRELPRGERPPANLVFLIDVSGSMQEANKLPLVKEALKLLVDGLEPKDRVAIVVYAGSEGLALPPTLGTKKEEIRRVLERLEAGGTTHGSAGLRLAYEMAEKGFVKGGVNRVILATDGDFNVGVTNQGELVRLIEEKAKSRVFLTTLGFGMGNLKDSTLEKLADRGNGNYAYIGSLWEARKVLVDQIGGTLVTIAKDVKLQLEFNPAAVSAFRLIGYENRILAHQDFNDDTKDAGEIGAGHTVTALYEIVPAGVEVQAPAVDPLKYQRPSRPSAPVAPGEVLTLKLRYKQPEGDQSTLMEMALRDSDRSFENASTDFRFAASVASFGMILRDSPHKGAANLRETLAWARKSLGPDEGSLRTEFVLLVEKARRLSPAR